MLNPRAMTFKIGQMAVYPAHGVVEVVGLDTKQIGGGLFAFYVLKVLENGMQIMVPKDKVTRLRMKLAEAGLLYPELPPEKGGRGASPYASAAVADPASRLAGAAARQAHH